jgi:hypothetical protein
VVVHPTRAKRVNKTQKTMSREQKYRLTPYCLKKTDVQ